MTGEIWKEKIIGKTQLERALLRGLGEVNIPAGAPGWTLGGLGGLLQHVPVQSEVPFAHHTGAVAAVLEKTGDRWPLGIHDGPVGWEENVFFEGRTPVIPAGENPVAGRGAD